MTTMSAERAQAPIWMRLGEIALAAAAYFLLARASLFLASVNASATPVWPPTGLAVALVLVRGKAMLPAVLIGALGANLAITPSLLTAGLIAIGNTGEAYVASLLLGRWADGQKAFYSPLGIAKFAIIVVALAAPLSATIGAVSLAATGYAQWRELAAVWTTWWLGDLAGATLATPALILWSRTIAGLEPRTISSRTFLTFAAALLVGLVAFSPLSPLPIGLRSAFCFLAILPLMWSALRLGLRDTATTALLMSSLAIWGVLARSSPFTQATLNDSLLLLVAFIVAATLPSLALAADRREAHATLTQTRQELAQSQKLEALGQLTGTVAHDFNNLLASIAGGLQLLNRQEAERKAVVETLKQTLDRGTALTKQLLAFARREPLKLELVNLADTVPEIENLIRQSLGDKIHVELRIGAGVWLVRIDRSQFDLALLNLALNARDAMPDGGSLLISVDNIADARRQSVAVVVSDNGVGMNADVLARAFEPFFSTKPSGSGTGLGLAQVYGFVKQSGGSANIESEPGRGAVVTLTLPRA